MELKNLYSTKQFEDPVIEEIMEYSDKIIEYEEDEENIQTEYLDEHMDMIEEVPLPQEIESTFNEISDTVEIFNVVDDSTTIMDDTDENFIIGAKKKYPRKRLKEPITCPKCPRTFYYKSYFTFHYKDVHFNQNELCSVCGKEFKNARRLNSHMLVHTHAESESKKFKCEICDKGFNYSGDLLRHKRTHNNIKPYKCTFPNCNKSFVQSYALKLHVDVHNQVRFKCDKCGSEFSVKATLKNHMAKCLNGGSREYQSNREKYKCFVEECSREFSSRKYLSVHLERIHQIKIENFETTCLECHMVFENVGDYSKHVRTHSCNFTCNLCKLRFKTETKLQSHIEKLHKEGENRPFICDFEDCGARFKRIEHLKGHCLYKHSDEKKFDCPDCPLKFKQRGELNLHMR
jgi:KRAB domain-containing zinc finger protein